MAKIEKASQEIEKMASDVLDEMGYGQIGEVLVFNMKKSNEVVKIKLADEVTETAIEKEDVIVVFVYEKAFEKVDKSTQMMWLRSEMDKLSYDYERDKFSLKTPMISLPLSFYQKHGEAAVKNLELAYYTIQQIQEEEKQRKAEEKVLKKSKSKRSKF